MMDIHHEDTKFMFFLRVFVVRKIRNSGLCFPGNGLKNLYEITWASC